MRTISFQKVLTTLSLAVAVLAGDVSLASADGTAARVNPASSGGLSIDATAKEASDAGIAAEWSALTAKLSQANLKLDEMKTKKKAALAERATKRRETRAALGELRSLVASTRAKLAQQRPDPAKLPTVSKVSRALSTFEEMIESSDLAVLRAKIANDARLRDGLTDAIATGLAKANVSAPPAVAAGLAFRLSFGTPVLMERAEEDELPAGLKLKGMTPYDLKANKTQIDALGKQLAVAGPARSAVLESVKAFGTANALWPSSSADGVATKFLDRVGKTAVPGLEGLDHLPAGDTLE